MKYRAGAILLGDGLVHSITWNEIGDRWATACAPTLLHRVNRALSYDYVNHAPTCLRCVVAKARR